MIKEIKRGPIYISHNSLRFITVFSRDITILDKKTLVITKKAQEFLESCLKGEETRVTGKLYVGASQVLRDLGLAMQILASMGKETWEERIDWLKTSIQALSQLKEGDSVSSDVVIEMRDFFSRLERFLSALDTVPTDRVMIKRIGDYSVV